MSREAPGAGRLDLRVHGLDCAEEVAVLRRTVGPVVGGEEHLAFDVLRGKMTVLPTAPETSLEACLFIHI